MFSTFALLAVLSAGVPQGVPEMDLLIRAKTLYVGDGRVLNDVVIGASGGKIVFVGSSAPAGSAPKETLEFADLHVTPGFVEGSTYAGLPRGASENEEGVETTPEFRISDAVDTSDDAFDRLLDVGVTTAVVVPGKRNVFGGLSAALKPRAGGLKEKLLRNDVSSLAVADRDPTAGNSPPDRGFFSRSGPGLFNRRPSTRMGVVFELRRGLQEGAGRNSGAGWTALYPEPAGLALARAARGEIPFAFIASNSTDALAAIRIAEEFGVKNYYLQDAGEAAFVAGKLASKKIGALIGPASFQAFSTSEGARSALMNAPRVLADAGVTFGLSRGGAQDGSTLRDFAIAAHRGGLKPGRAVAAVTGDPAKITGLADRVGQVAVGLDADLLLFEGDPLAPSSRLAAVVLDGKVVRRAVPRN